MSKEDLIFEAASIVHDDWCRQEYKAFFERTRKENIDGKDLNVVLNSACYKGEKKEMRYLLILMLCLNLMKYLDMNLVSI